MQPAGGSLAGPQVGSVPFPPIIFGSVLELAFVNKKAIGLNDSRHDMRLPRILPAWL